MLSHLQLQFFPSAYMLDEVFPPYQHLSLHKLWARKWVLWVLVSQCWLDSKKRPLREQLRWIWELVFGYRASSNIPGPFSSGPWSGYLQFHRAAPQWGTLRGSWVRWCPSLKTAGTCLYGTHRPQQPRPVQVAVSGGFWDLWWPRKTPQSTSSKSLLSMFFKENSFYDEWG